MESVNEHVADTPVYIYMYEYVWIFLESITELTIIILFIFSFVGNDSLCALVAFGSIGYVNF